MRGSGESGHIRLDPHFKRKEFNILPLIIMLIVEFSCMPFIRLRKFSSISILCESFLVMNVLNFKLFLMCPVDHLVFSFNLLVWQITMIYFQILK